jgi:hypothetical protein
VDGHRLWRLFNLLFAIALPTIYVVFAFAILVKLRAYGAAHQNSAHHASQKKVQAL